MIVGAVGIFLVILSVVFGVLHLCGFASTDWRLAVIVIFIVGLFAVFYDGAIVTFLTCCLNWWSG